jgi:hypothetical protein
MEGPANGRKREVRRAKIKKEQHLEGQNRRQSQSTCGISKRQGENGSRFKIPVA